VRAAGTRGTCIELLAVQASDPLRAWIRLTKTGASARRLNTLLERFGSPEAVFAAAPAELAAAIRAPLEVAGKLLDPMYAANDRDLKLMDRLKVRLVPRTDADYPPLLQEIPDPPVALYVRGNLAPEDGKAVAIVGSRRATDYGKRTAHRLAEELVQAGYTVVSGLARGADTAAHHGAIRAGGRTLACLGCGVDVAYPYENRELAQAVTEHGALLSEYPMTAPPDAWHFPSRNRVISGLSLGVVVIEAPKGSGALITAECAVDQNREVFAVPGNVDNFRNQGPHALIRDGAKLVETVEDILDELRGGPVQPSLALEEEEVAEPELAPDESAVLALLSPDPKPVDDLILESSLPAARVNAALVLLEIKGMSRRLPGNAFIRVR
jgi:DNA processing protein